MLYALFPCDQPLIWFFWSTINVTTSSLSYPLVLRIMNLVYRQADVQSYVPPLLIYTTLTLVYILHLLGSSHSLLVKYQFVSFQQLFLLQSHHFFAGVIPFYTSTINTVIKGSRCTACCSRYITCYWSPLLKIWPCKLPSSLLKTVHRPNPRLVQQDLFLYNTLL